jgi:MFS family permease
MILGRVIQGAGAATFPLSFSIVRDEFPREKVANAMGWISGLMGVGSALALVIAGPIVETFSYHWLFWVPLGVTVVAVTSGVLFVPESQVRAPGKVHFTGALLLSAWLVCLLVGITKGAQWSWVDPRVLGLFALALILFTAWVFAESRVDEPLIDLKLMRLRGVWTVNAAALLISVGTFTGFILIPRFAEGVSARGFGFDATLTEAGLFTLPSTILMVITGPICGRLAHRFGGHVPLIVGGLFQVSAYLLLTFVHGDPISLYGASVLIGCGVGLSFASFPNLLVDAVPAVQMGMATGMNSVCRYVGGGFGAQVVATILAAEAVGGFDTERGFVLAFVTAGSFTLLGVAVALFVPRRSRRRLEPAMVGAR